VTRAGERLFADLSAMRQRHHIIGTVQGRGLMVGIDTVDANAPRDGNGIRPPAPGVARALQAACYERGLLTEIGGVYGNVLRLMPPLTISDEELDDVVSILDDSLSAVGRRQVP
jgi:diaminobutyrate-2-oxoglutarate transaminase